MTGPAFKIAIGLILGFGSVATAAGRAKPHVNIGTIGHIDHGKATLTAAITKVLRKQDLSVTFRPLDSIDNPPGKTLGGIKIAVAHVEYHTKNRHYAHVNWPSHSDFVKSILTARTQIDGAILVVAATDGPMPQTRDQIRLARQVGVPRIVVFLDKVDIVDDPEPLALVELEVRALLSSYGFPGDDVPVIQGSASGALNGEEKWERGIDELMKAVDSYIPTPERDRDKPFLMPIEDVFSISGRGTMVTGHIERGVVKVGDEVEIVGLRDTQKKVIAAVEMSKKPLDQGEAGNKLGLLVRGLEKDEVERGQVVAKPGSIRPHRKFKGEVYVLKTDEGGRHKPFLNGYRPQFYFRTTDVTGVANLPEGTEMVMPGDNVTLNVELISPIAMEKGLPFAIREGNRTVGVGAVAEIAE